MYLKGILERCHLGWNKEKHSQFPQSCYDISVENVATVQEAGWDTQPGMSMASCRLHKTQMDWGNSGVICAGNKNLWVPHEEDKRWKHFMGRENCLFCATASFKVLKTNLEKERVRPVRVRPAEQEKGKISCWTWHCDHCDSCYQCLLQIPTTTKRDGTTPVPVCCNTMKTLLLKEVMASIPGTMVAI